MPQKYKTATKTAISTQTKVLVAVVAIAALGLAAYGYGFGFGSFRFKAAPKASQRASAPILGSIPTNTQPIPSPVENPPSYTIGAVQQISPSSRPVFTKHQLATNTLFDGDRDLYKFQISSEVSSKVVSWKQMVFSFEIPPSVSVSNLRLRKGSFDMSPSDYDITCPACGGDVKFGTITTAASPIGLLVVTIKNQELIFGSGNVYALHGTLSGVTNGQSLKMSLYRDPNQTISNGYLTNNAVSPFMSTYQNIVNIDMTYPPKSVGNQADLPGFFVWSASSTNYATGLNGGSSEWFSDLQVDTTKLMEELKS